MFRLLSSCLQDSQDLSNAVTVIDDADARTNNAASSVNPFVPWWFAMKFVRVEGVMSMSFFRLLRSCQGGEQRR